MVRRATCVATMRSAGRWNEPTFSVREWRSAALARLGANGSWTWQTSSASPVCRASTVRVTSIGRAARRAEVGRASPTWTTPGSPPAPQSASGSRLQRRARRLDRVVVLRRGDDEHAVPPGGELSGDPAHEVVDGMPGAPGEGRDLRDGQHRGARLVDPYASSGHSGGSGARLAAPVIRSRATGMLADAVHRQTRP